MGALLNKYQPHYQYDPLQYVNPYLTMGFCKDKVQKHMKESLTISSVVISHKMLVFALLQPVLLVVVKSRYLPVL